MLRLLSFLIKYRYTCNLLQVTFTIVRIVDPSTISTLAEEIREASIAPLYFYPSGISFILLITILMVMFLGETIK